MARRAHYEFMSGISQNTKVALSTQDTSMSSVEGDILDLQTRAAFKDEHNVFTESQTIDKGAANADLHIAADDGFYAALSFEGTGNLSRWNFVKTASGSNLAISRFNSGGSLVDTPINVSWSTGVVDFEHTPTVDGVNLIAMITPEQFGATGGSDDATAIQSFFDYLSTNEGAVGLLSRWYNIGSAISLTAGGTTHWACIGVGRYLSGLRATNTYSSTSALAITNYDNFTLDNFGIDAGRSRGAIGGHCFRIVDCNDYIISRIYGFDWGDNGGLHLSVSSEAFVSGARVIDFHLDGNSEDGVEGAGNGLNLVNHRHSYVAQGLVENVHSASTCIALQFKGDCLHGVIENCRVRNCFLGCAAQQGDGNEPGRQQKFSNIHIYEPNANGPGGGAYPIGVRFSFGSELTAEDILIDGNDVNDFTAIRVSPSSSSDTIKASVFNCGGTTSYALRIEGPKTLVVLEHLGGVAAVPILVTTDNDNSKVIIGLYDDGAVPADPLDLTTGTPGTDFVIKEW